MKVFNIGRRWYKRRIACVGLNLGNMAKMLKCAGNDDIITMKASDEADSVTFMFESPSEYILSHSPFPS
jgi:hypothetical protein